MASESDGNEYLNYMQCHVLSSDRCRIKFDDETQKRRRAYYRRTGRNSRLVSLRLPKRVRVGQVSDGQTDQKSICVQMLHNAKLAKAQ
jgi:hypothetical protein